MTSPNWGRSITACMDGLSRYLTGWMAHYRLLSPDADKGLGVLDAHIRRRIRAIIVRQKKRPRFLLRHSSRSWRADRPPPAQRTAAEGPRPALTRAYPPSWFTGRLVSLKTRWEELNAPQVSDQLSLAL